MLDRTLGRKYFTNFMFNRVRGDCILSYQNCTFMKKLLYCAAALSAVLFVGSCQRENLEPVVNGGVTYTISLPETVQTKGESGYTSYDLYYEVYKTADLTALEDADVLFDNFDAPIEMTSNTTVVPFDLLNDQDYTILFWANKAGAKDENGQPYFNLADLRKVGINAAASNNNDRDAFCAMDQLENVNGALTKTVTLTRPFAQLNIATEIPDVDYDVIPDYSYVKVTKVPTVYNVATGAATGDAVVEFATAAVPAGKKVAVGAKEYDLVAMNYVLVPESNIEVYYAIETANGVVTNTINNVPVKKNYRTNIIGNLLTSNATYTVELKPGFEEGSIYGPEFVQEPKFNAETKTYVITNALELKWVAQQVNSGKKSFKGETVQLASDVDLKNEPWTPIGYGGKHFQGTFEGVALTKTGNDYPTISNLFIENGKYAGLFGTISDGGLLRNFNLDHVRISGSDYLGAVLGQIYTTVDNVTVTDAEITAVPYLLADGVTYDGGAKVGGIAGLVGDSATITNCTVENATFKAYRDMGGIVGTTQNNYPTTLTGNSVADLTFIVTGFYTPYNGNDKPGHYAPIRGGKRSNSGDVIENNTGDDIELHKVLVEATEGGVYDSEEKVYTVTSPAGLAAALQGSGAAGAGNHTIQIEGDLDMTGIDWTPINVDGYNGADIVTVEGNGATIKGLDGALFAGGFAGGSGIVIKDLTIEDAYMIADNTQGYGAFVNCADSMDEITLINCHLKNSTIITPNDGAAESRIGGLVGWTAGYNNQNDGPVDSYITIQNCSVTDCTLKGAGSIGGICGHAGANVATFTKIENCTVTGNTLVSTDDGDWRVGAIVGTANNGQCEIKNVTVSGNTISQVGKTAEVYQSELYGRFVPSGTGTLTIDGVAVSATKPALLNGYTALYNIDGNYYVYNKKGLEELNNFFKANAFANHVWTRSYNIGADIDATGFAWDCVYLVVGSNDLNGLVLNGNGYTISNLTINGGGLFTGTPKGANEGTESGYVKNITIDSATVTGDHTASVFWANAHGEIVYENVVVKNTSVTGNCNVGVFIGATTIDYPTSKIDPILFKNCAVENCEIVANGKIGQDPTGASGFIGRAFGKTSLKFEGTNTIDEATTITNNNGLVGGRVYAYTTWVDGGFEGTGACDTFTNWGGVSLAAKVGTIIYNTIQEAIAAATAGDTVKLLDDVPSSLTLPAGITFNGNGKQINGSIKVVADVTFAGHTKATKLETGSNLVLTVDEGACLEVTGGDRSTLGYNNEFKFIGTLEDAKSADKTKIQPSLILPGGLSVTGGNDAVMSFTNAYVKIGNTSSKNSVANGTFTLNIENSIAEFTNQLTFAEPTSGKNPTFNLNVKNSVLTTATKLCIAAPNTNVVIDNSTVTLGTYLRNSGSLTLKNGSTLTGATIQFGENGGNNGAILVDASTFTIKANSSGHAFDGKGVGAIDAQNGAEVFVDYYKAMTITTDATSTFTGTEVQ